MIGETVAHYRVTEKLGEGGMGVVYRATDTKLGREVALKVLPAVFAGDPQRMARFSREAQVLASLNHPHIASIYGLEETDGVRALAMELAEGEDLSDRIAKGRIPLEEALSIALQVAEALEDAHEKSIIHRDLKPANIKITPDGRVKVLDFGLAKALEEGRPQEEMANSPTLTMAATQAGVILGTAGYMSPEQARGSAADKRSDIWSFGVVLFEMLSGKSAFDGKTMSDVLASVLKVDVNWQNLPQGLPNQVLRVLHRTLQEDPSQRIHDIADVGIDLREALSDPKYDVSSSDSTVAAKPDLRAVVPWALLGVAVVALFVLWLQPGGSPLPLLKLRIPVEPAKSFASDVSTGRSRLNFNNKPRLSPDGTRVAYTAAGMLWVRSLDELEPRLVSDLPQAGSPFWSPDSESLGFSIRDTVYRFARRDSVPTEICTLDGSIIGCVWGPNDRIVISKWRGGLYEVSARGGTPKLIIDPLDGEVDFHDPYFLQGTDILLANIHAEKEAESYIAKIANGKSIRLEETTSLGDQVSHAVYDQSGHLLYTTADRRIWAVPFSKGSLTPIGEPFQVAVEGTFPDVADNGTLLYLDLSSVEDRVFQLVWLSREGEVAGSIGEPMVGITLPRLSPDGGHVAFSANTDTENAGTDLWVIESDGQRPRRLTFDAGNEADANWSPNGKQIVFTSYVSVGESGILVTAADGSGAPQKLRDISGSGAQFAPDGESIIFAAHDVRGDDDLAVYGLRSNELVPFLETEDREEEPALSPDGRFLAYSARVGEEYQIYVRPYPVGEGRWQLSITGGRRPIWSRDGEKLFFRFGNRLLEVEIETSPSLRYGPPVELFETGSLGISLQGGFDVALEGDRFLAVQEVNPSGNRPQMVIVQNWLAEFHHR